MIRRNQKLDTIINFRANAELKQKLEAMASLTGVSESDLGRGALEIYLDKLEKSFRVNEKL